MFDIIENYLEEWKKKWCLGGDAEISKENVQERWSGHIKIQK